MYTNQSIELIYVPINIYTYKYTNTNKHIFHYIPTFLDLVEVLDFGARFSSKKKEVQKVPFIQDA